MNITLIAVGHKMPAWVDSGFRDYQKRLSGFAFKLVEIVPVKRSKTLSSERICLLEGEKILQKIPANALVVALEVKGRQFSTEKLAQQLESWQQSGRNLVLVIGGADGLSQAVLQRAQQLWSLSELTFPHPLARLITIEQIYRAWSINANHPYHRAG